MEAAGTIIPTSRSREDAGGDPEYRTLRRVVRDLVALSAMPSVWVDPDIRRSIQNLADVVRAALRAFAVCVRVELPDGHFETTSATGLRRASRSTHELTELLDAAPAHSTALIRLPRFNGSGPVNALPHPVYSSEKQIGVLVACYPADFQPDDNAQLLLHVAACQLDLLLERFRDQEDRFARILAEERLRKTEHHYQQLVQALPAAVYTCDQDGRITLYNEAAAALWGRRPKINEDLWCGSWNILKPDGSPLPLDECPMAIAIREGRSVRGQEIIVERPDGTHSWVLAHPDPIRDESGKIVGAVNMLVVIDELKRAEQELKNREQHLRAIVENTPECVKLVAADGTLLEMNGAGMCMVEADSAGQVIGKSIYEVIAPEYRETFRAMNERVCAGNNERLEFEIIGLKGTRRWMETHAAPIADPSSGRAVQIAVTRDTTARRKAELELRRKNKQLAAFLETAAVGLHRVGPDGIIQWANDAELHMLGYSPEEYIGHHVAEFHADEPVIGDILKRLTCGEKLYGYGARLKCKDGSIKDVLIDSSVLWEDGQFVHTQCFTRDVTERKRAEEALRQTNERLQKVLEIETVGVMFWDLKSGSLIDANDTFLKMMGYSRQEVESRALTWEKFTPPEFLEISRAEIAKFMTTGRVGPYEKEYFHKDGSRKWLLFAGSSLGDDQCVEFCVDISERKRAEEPAARLAAIVEHSDDAIFSTDLDGMITSWNAGAERLYGYSAAEAIGQPIAMLVPEARKAEEAAILRRIRNGESVDNYETERRRKDGAPVEVSLTVSPIKDTTGKIIGVSKVARDNTEKVRARELLEQTVRERTASLRDALEQMEEFSYTVSHDLRAPLRAMQGYSEALLEEHAHVLNSDGIRFLKRIAENSTRLDKMILDVLTFSRLARADLKLEPISLDKLVRGIVENYAGMQPPHAQIQVDCPHVIMGHEPSVVQALSNLLTNSVKFVAPGNTPSIHVSSEQEGSAVTIRVHDNGIGVPPKYQPRLFNMFERVHPNLKYDGTGVGLAIVRKAVERMGGRVGMESDGVSGSCFWIQLQAAGPPVSI